MDQVLETIKRAHQGDKAARDRLVTGKYATGMEHCASVFQTGGMSQEDLFQIGSIGLTESH